MSEARTEKVLELTQDDLDRASNVRFIREIEAGMLSPQTYANYLFIEAAFVETAARLLGKAVTYAPTWAALVGHGKSLAGLVTEQNQYFIDAIERWGVAPDVGEAAQAEAEELSKKVNWLADTKGYPGLVVGLFAAENLYRTWCRRASASPHIQVGAVQDWVDLHAAEPFSEQVDFLRREVDQLPGSISAAEISEWYAAMLDAENRFHDSVYR